MQAGLCDHCRHCQLVDTARSRFYLCRRSFTDDAFPKYPRLPVTACLGYESRSPHPAPTRGQDESDP